MEATPDNLVERTLMLVKPDGVRRGLVGEILRRFERAGLAVIGVKLVRPSRDYARRHYATTPAFLRSMGEKTLKTYRELGIDANDQLGTSDPLEIGEMVHEWNAEFLSSGPVLAVVLEGIHAVKKARAISGATMPRDALPGTIRGDFASASPAIANVVRSAVHNLVHTSDNELDPKEPEREIDYWFTRDELVPYEPAIHKLLY